MDRLLAWAQSILLGLSAVYLAFLALATLPSIQSHAIYLHALRWPLFANLSNVAEAGLAASRSMNIQLHTRDGVRLGAWLILPPTIDEDPFSESPSEEVIVDSLRSRPTVLFFHGNAATRAVHFRVQHCTTYATRFDANVLAIDYRGFGDSEGFPTEQGLVSDARAAWDWAISNGAKPDNILLVGLSLGTGVASALGAELATENTHPQGVVLLAPFTSIPELLSTYHLFGFIPILQPIRPFPWAQKYVLEYLRTHYNTSSVLKETKAPILLVHSKDDTEIPYTHSETLFESFVQPLLPDVPNVPVSPSELRSFDWDAYRAAKDVQLARRIEVVQEREIPSFGSLLFVDRRKNRGRVYYLDAKHGGHNRVGFQESTVDVIKSIFFK